MTPSAQKSPLLPKHQSQIQRWQEGATSEPEQQIQGIVARLFDNCFNSLRCIVGHTKLMAIYKSDSSTLRRCLSSLQLWAEGHQVITGTLDKILNRSNSLRLTTLSILNPMRRVLSQGSSSVYLCVDLI